MSIIEITYRELLLTGTLVIALAVCTVISKLGVARPLLIAALRMAIQLTLVGMILNFIFTKSGILWVAGISLVMLAVAGREVAVRSKRPLAGWWGYAVGTGSMFVSSFAVAIFALAGMIRADPWYEPQYAIPILGMLLGNTMNGIALSMDRLTDAAWRNRDEIEARLMLGEQGKTAIGDFAKDAVRSGLIPVINAMAVAGIVSLPGMMTGQILAGNDPSIAVKYQILIWLLIAAGCGFGMLLAIRLTVHLLFDERHRLRLDRLKKPDRS
ncbi:MAG: iron export ABC transporter permease subunit FetB [Verrucomicrobiales bacterium]|nr:iron export ABC transporter permease subunit FetB [Verrucomicrobiales bacterium]